jgi:hypothetical protein
MISEAERVDSWLSRLTDRKHKHSEHVILIAQCFNGRSAIAVTLYIRELRPCTCNQTQRSKRVYIIHQRTEAG